MKKIFFITTIFLAIFTLGCTNNIDNSAEESTSEYHALLVTSTPAVTYDSEKYQDYIKKIAQYSEDINNKVDLIYFSGQYAPQLMKDFQANIDPTIFSKDVLLFPITNDIDINSQILDYQKKVEENEFDIYKLTIFGEKYSEEEALASANALYNEYVTEEDKQKMADFLNKWKEEDFETLKTQLHILKNRDFSTNLFTETPEVSFREFNLLISEDEKQKIISGFFNNIINFFNSY